jgi:hypothetical protein
MFHNCSCHCSRGFVYDLNCFVTGTGKTATFSISILQQIDTSNHECQALILAPTRELAQQVFEKIQYLLVQFDFISFPETDEWLTLIAPTIVSCYRPWMFPFLHIITLQNYFHSLSLVFVSRLCSIFCQV